VFPLKLLQTCNNFRDTRAWHFEIDKIPDKERQSATSLEDKVNSQLWASNRGVIYE